MRIWAALATIYVVWGSTFLAIAVAVRDLPPFLSMALRHLVAGGVLFGVGLVASPRRAPARATGVGRIVRLRRGALPHRPWLARLGAAGRPVGDRCASGGDDPAVVRDPRARGVRRAARRPRRCRAPARLRGPRVTRRPLGARGSQADRRARDRPGSVFVGGGLTRRAAVAASAGHAPLRRDGNAVRRRPAGARERPGGRV
jgi:hypothetical protein